jgi:hypothetical protein
MKELSALPDQVAVHEIVGFMGRILQKRTEAGRESANAHWFQRGSAGASAAVATLTGGALLGSVHGRAAVVIGIIAAGIGILAGGIAAARPGDSYVADLARKAQYEQLFWEVRTFAIARMPKSSSSDYEDTMRTFYQRFAAIMDAGGAGGKGS